MRLPGLFSLSQKTHSTEHSREKTFHTMTIPLRDFDSFFQVSTWSGWLDNTLVAFSEYTFPWLISNLIGVVSLLVAVRSPNLSRKTWGFLLIVAAVVNAYTVLTDPTAYHEFGVVAIPPIQKFIYSRCFARPEYLVFPIAVCQGLVGIELLFDNSSRFRRVLALRAAIVFFIGIATLGVGSAFPSSLLYAMTMKLCWPSDTKSKKVV